LADTVSFEFDPRVPARRTRSATSSRRSQLAWCIALLAAVTGPLVADLGIRFSWSIILIASVNFLGLGLRPPAISLGVLLQDAQNVQAIAITPWLLMPAVPVMVAVLAFNFLGDGLRDAADPYGR